METIQVEKEVFEAYFQNTLDKLKLVSLREGTINVKLNDQVDVTNFISNLHRQFHYEVCMLKKRLKEK